MFERTEILHCQKRIRLELISLLFKFNKRNASSVEKFRDVENGLK